MITKKERCIPCSIVNENNPMGLILMDPERYEGEDDIPNNRIYSLVCLNCGREITKYVTENTITAVKELRDQMDFLYGISVTWARMPTLKESMVRLGFNDTE